MIQTLDLIICFVVVMTLDFVFFKYIYMFGFLTYSVDNKKLSNIFCLSLSIDLIKMDDIEFMQCIEIFHRFTFLVRFEIK